MYYHIIEEYSEEIEEDLEDFCSPEYTQLCLSKNENCRMTNNSIPFSTVSISKTSFSCMSTSNNNTKRNSNPCPHNVHSFYDPIPKPSGDPASTSAPCEEEQSLGKSNGLTCDKNRLPAYKIEEQGLNDIISEIIEGSIYIGSHHAAKNKKLLQDLKIGYILNVSKEVPCFYATEDNNIQYLHLPLLDSEGQNICFRQHFDTAHSFIHQSLQKKSAVLIHCVAGVSRSSTIAISYLMKWKMWSLLQAYHYVKRKRPCVNPNINFLKHLIIFQHLLYVSHYKNGENKVNGSKHGIKNSNDEIVLSTSCPHCISSCNDTSSEVSGGAAGEYKLFNPPDPDHQMINNNDEGLMKGAQIQVQHAQHSYLTNISREDLLKFVRSKTLESLCHLCFPNFDRKLIQSKVEQFCTLQHLCLQGVENSLYSHYR